MNYHAYKFTDLENGYYFIFISPFSEQHIDCVLESVEHYIANEPTQMNQYLMTLNFDEVKIEKIISNPIDIFNNAFPADEKNMLVSSSYVSLIPPPKVKRTPKPKADKPPKKEPKPRGAKKGSQNVQISAEPVLLDMNK